MTDARLAPVLHHLRRLAVPSAEDLPNSILLEQFVSRQDSAAFEALVRRHGPLVWRVCLRVLHREQDAEDAFQATFLALARRAAAIREPGSLASFLHGAAYRIARRIGRDDERRRAVERQGSLAQPADPMREAAMHELGGIIEEEVHRLPEKLRAALLLCYWEGLTNEEAAGRLGWPCGTVKTRLAKAREVLQIRLTRRGVALPAGVVALLLAPHAGEAKMPAILVSKTLAPPARIAALAEGGLTRLTAAKWKVAALLVLAAAMTGTAGVLMYSSPSGERQPPVAEKNQGADAPRSPKTKQPARTDRYGDPLPEGAIARLGTLRFRSVAQVFNVAYSPDGRLLATSGFEGAVCLWQSATGKEVLRILPRQASSQGAPDLEFSPDGKLLAVGERGKNAVRLWDVSTGKERRRLPIPDGGNAASIAFSPDGTILAGTCWVREGPESHSRIRLWHVKTGREVAGFESPTGKSWSLTFTPDGKSLAIRREDEVFVCDAATGRNLRTFRCSHGVAALSTDGVIAAITEDGKAVRLWDAATGREKHVLRGHTQGIGTLVFSRDGKRLISCALDGTFVWDVASGKQVVSRLRAGSLGERGLALSPDGKTLTMGSGGYALRRWDMATGEEIAERTGHKVSVDFVAFTPDGRVVTSGFGGDLRIWEAATSKQLARMHVENTQIDRSTVLSPDGRIVAVSCGDGSIRLWDLKTGKETAKLPIPREEIFAPYLAFAPDGKTLAAAYRGSTIPGRDRDMIVVWDAASGKPRRQFPLGRNEVSPLAFSPDGKRLTSLNAGLVWNIVSGKELGRFPRMGSPQGMVRFSPDGLLRVTPNYPNGFTVWDAVSRGLIGHFGEVTSRSVAFSPDGRLLACGKDDGTIELWEVLTWTLAGKRQGSRGRVLALDFSADGRLLGSGHEDTTALIWDVPSLWAPAERTAAMTKERLDALWTQLGSGQSAEAFRAIAALRQAPGETLPLLRKRIHPARADDASTISRLIADLDSDTFAVREKAARQLQSRGPAVIPALRKAMVADPSPEARRRIEAVLEVVGSKKPHERMTAEERRSLRAIAVLEQIATSKARQLLEELTGGAAEDRLTREAKASLERLAKRRDPQP